MPEASHRILVEFFTHDLPFTPRPRDIDLFESDLRLVSPYLMQAALKEVAAGRAMSGRSIDEWRQAIFRIYNRKVAEHSQLFPVFHSFETALRSTVAVELESHYRRRDWWQPNYRALLAGNEPKSVAHINNVPLPRQASFLIQRVIQSQIEAKVVINDLDDGFKLLEGCDLFHVGNLISAHWHVFGLKFRRGRKRLTENDFITKFNRVRDARNDVYHHRSVARMSGVVAAAEDILDYLDFSLSFVVTKIASAQPSPLTFMVPIEPKRHHTW